MLRRRPGASSRGGGGGRDEDSHAGEARKGFREKLELLAEELGACRSDP